MSNFSYNTFLRPLSSTDKTIKILDEDLNIRWNLNPFTIKNVFVSNNLLKISLNSDRTISLDFNSTNDAKLALPILRNQIETLTNQTPLRIDKIVEEYINGIGLSYSNGNLFVNANLIPSISGSFSLGSSVLEWKDLFVSTSSIYIGGVTISSDGSNILVNGSPISGSSSQSLVELTYSELSSLIETSNLNPGAYYKITDFKTCYDQPNYDVNRSPITTGNYKVGNTQSIVVFSTSENTISQDAWQSDFPNDKIRYDWTWNQTEVTGGTAFGRIIERIDELNNRADYDHREVKFVRYPFWVWDKDNPFAGTISVVGGATAGGMTVSGVGTDFNSSHQPWDVISIPNLSGTFFLITEIISATQMVIESNLSPDISGLYNGLKYYWSGFEGNVSYYQSVLDGLTASFTASEHLLFDGVTAINNYFGDVANLVYLYEDTFILPNNVFFDGSYRNNRFGNYCINNTLDHDCDGNDIGHEFVGNIVTGNFDDNRIGNSFFGNVITGNFEDNEIGNYFEENYIINQYFNDNKIGDYFYNNKVWSKGEYDFANNVIGSSFDSNEIYRGFDSNHIGYSFDDNDIYSGFFDNQIGNDFDENTIGIFENGVVFVRNQIGNGMKGNNFEGEVFGNIMENNFYDNNILGDFSGNHISNYFFSNEIVTNSQDGFSGNHIGNFFAFNEIGDEFINNEIGSFFTDNTIGERFGFNKVGHYFNNNNIGDDFGYGEGEAYGNKIDSYFQNNEIGKYFYSNTIIDLFSDNITGNYFRFNDIQVQNLNNVDFTTNYGNILSFTYQSSGTNSTPGFYDILSGTTNGFGESATFGITVSVGTISDVSLVSAGNQYTVGDTIVISGTQIGGVSGEINTFSTNSLSVKIYKPADSTYEYPSDETEMDYLIDNSPLFETYYSSNIQGVSYTTKKGGIDQDNYAMLIEGYIQIPSDNTYYFGLSSDDSSDAFINGIKVADWYGAHGDSGNEPDGNIYPILLTTGTYPIKVRLLERSGGDIVSLLYSLDGINWNIIPDSPSFFGEVWFPLYISGVTGSYPGIFATGGTGEGSTFDVEVIDGLVDSVVLSNGGGSYQVGETLTISASAFGGTQDINITIDSVYSDDVTITVTVVSATPSVYGDYNSTIFRNSNGLERLSYYDENDVLNIDFLTP